MGRRPCSAILALAFLAFTLAGCPKGLSREELEALSVRCKQELFVSTGAIAFFGYTHNQMANIEVVEEREGMRVGSFSLHGQPVSANYGEDRFTASLPHALRSDTSYLINVPGEPIRRLSRLRIGLAPHFSMMAEGWGCDLESYTLDGEEHRGKSPSIGRSGASK